ncbi:MAG: cell division protein ZapA [Nitrospirota bacterium]|nr:MAG: cell division protein ZapA [Nitrospirota bacterium]
MGSIEVVILGQRYTIKGDADEEYIRKLADFVDKKMKEVIEAAPNTSPLKASILAALNIADELHKADQSKVDLGSLEEKANVLSGLFD